MIEGERADAVSGSPRRPARSLLGWPRRCWRDLAGLGSVFAMAFAYLSPALKDGARFGSFDFVIPLTTLGRGAYSGKPFNHVNSDVVSQMNAWNLFDWTQIHAGHFPLWNDLSLLGVPQFLNFESAVLSLPDLVSYAVPLSYAFFVAVIVKLLIAGIGAYVLARVLGLRPLGASFAGISFMLSGAFANWLTWPLTDVVAWLGWITAFAVLAYRRPDRFRYLVGLAVSVAFCLYGGFPEANVFVALAVAVLAVVFAAASTVVGHRHRRSRGGAGTRAFALGGLSRVAGGGIVGVLLALPLWWPGLQILQLAHRRTEGGFPGLPAKSMSLLLAQGYYGLPTRANTFGLKGWNYYESASYVGVIMVVLAVVAVVKWWYHPTVLALAALCVVALAVAYQLPSFHPIQHFLNHVSGQVQWERFRTILGLPLGLLAGLGLETVIRRWRSRATFGAFAVATVLVAAVVAVLASRRAPTAALVSVRDRSLIWPVGLVGLCAVCAIAWAVLLVLAARGGARAHGTGRAVLPALVAGGLWAGSAGFLLFAGVGINAYSHTLYPVTPAIAALQRYVGSDLVGLDDRNATNAQQFSPVGFYPEVNLGYGIAEFAGHDPVLPQSYFSTLVPGTGAGGPGYFEPDVDTASLARAYGTPYVLALPGLRPIPGSTFVADIAGEQLYFVPGAARFTLSGGGRVSQVRHPSATEYDMETRTAGRSSGETLTVRVTAVPGWHASIDGHAAQLHKFDGVMWSLAVPAGTHDVRIWYWPDRLSEGLAAAGLGAVALGAWGAIACWSRRRRRPPTTVSASGTDVFSLAPLFDSASESAGGT
ncbi:MAG: YfhO family protein [Acidimicrobiales bacterium]